MKNISIALIFIVSFSLLQSSCKRGGCTDVEAENFELKANKDDGSCKYYAEDFIGTYNVGDMEIDPFFVDTTYKNYVITVTQTTGNTVNILNVNAQGGNVSATIKNGQLTIASQTDVFAGYTIIGSGTCSFNTISWQYNLDFGDKIVTGTCVKQ